MRKNDKPRMTNTYLAKVQPRSARSAPICGTGKERHCAVSVRLTTTSSGTRHATTAYRLPKRNRSLVRSAELGLILEPPKSKASRRVIDLDDGTIQILREHKVQQMEQRLILGRTYEDNDLVFPNELGGVLNPMALTRALERTGKRVEAGHQAPRSTPLPRFCAATKWSEPGTGEQKVRTFDGQHDLGHIRAPTPWLAEGDSRGVRQGNEPRELTAMSAK